MYAHRTSSRHARLSRGAQRGAALVVGLLLLLVLTLLAVSGMNSATLELVMAGNTQHHQNAFQAAETGIEQTIRDSAFNPSATPETIAVTADHFSAVNTPQLSGAPQPAILGSSWNSFSSFHFEIRSEGTSLRDAIAVNRQGVAVIAPFDPTVRPLDAASPALN
jgi:type IV pilus assembly protein PilX